MDDLKPMYEAVSAIWRLRKKYGPGPLKGAEWEQFVDDGKQLQKGFARQNLNVDRFFRDCLIALREYYSRTETRG